VATATQDQNLRLTFQNLPPLLQQLRPSMTQLSNTLTANTPVLQNLNAASGQLDRLLTDLPGFANSARPALKSLGQASVTGKVAVKAATPTVADLNTFAKPTPELAQNLAIVLRDLDSRSRAVEPDPRSPGGKGFTGLEALLGYAFNQTLAINYYGPLGHMLGVDAFINGMCAPYATPATVSMNLKQNGTKYRQCYSFLGPDQPGVTTADPSDPGAAIPDPGGGGRVSSSASAATAADVSTVHTANSRSATKPASTSGASTTGSGSSAPAGSSSGSASSGGPPINLPKTLGQILKGGSGPGASTTSAAPAAAKSTTAKSTTGKSSATKPASPAPSTPSASSATGSSSGDSGSQTQALLNYLMAP
jgi:hypothetical protein